MFDSHINYANLIWGQILHALSRIIILQKKALFKSVIQIQPFSET